jgi:hypothetical protein
MCVTLGRIFEIDDCGSHYWLIRLLWDTTRAFLALPWFWNSYS